MECHKIMQKPPNGIRRRQIKTWRTLNMTSRVVMKLAMGSQKTIPMPRNGSAKQQIKTWRKLKMNLEAPIFRDTECHKII